MRYNGQAMKKKVLIVITKGNWGGAQKYVHDLATSLPQEQYEVVAAIGEGEVLPDKLESAGIRVVRFNKLGRDVNPIADFASFRALRKLLRIEKPDILHLNSSKIGGIGGVAGRLEGIHKIIFTAHGWAFNEARNPFVKAIIYFLYWITILLSHTTIAVSNTMKHQIRALPFTQRKVVVIHNGISVPDFLSRQDARDFLEVKTACKNTQGLLVGTIAELHHIKGIRYLIEAASFLRNRQFSFRFFIFGDGDLRDALTKLIRDRGLEETVYLCGHIDNAARYLKAFDLYLQPSLSEGLSLAVIEAGIAQLPVVATHVGGIPEIIRDEEMGVLVPPRDAEAIAEELEHLTEHSDTREKYGKALGERVQKDFSKEKMLERTIAVYER